MFAYRLGFQTCRLSTVYTEVISIAFPKLVFNNLIIGWCAGLVIHQQVSIRFFGLFVISVHKVHSILVKHAFSNNSDLFSIARTSEESQVLGISADIIFPFRKHVLQQ